MTTAIRTLIVDDEPLARRGVRARLSDEAGFEIVGECKSGREAVAAIRRLGPDLVFLDVQMPGLSGFDVIAQVGPERMPMVIFVTAHDEHAIRAFSVQALDYLLKPIDGDRFLKALDGARRKLADRRDSSLGRKLAALLGERAGGSAPSGERIPVRDRGRIVLLDARDIECVEAEGDYVSVRAAGKTYLVRETMTAMESRLGAPRFLRIHRSTIVNVDRVREVRPQTNNEYVVVLRDGLELKASRSYGDRLRQAIGTPL